MSRSNVHANTISLIGMPGCGKSTVGVILAKLTRQRFVDTDLEIQVREGATLQRILDTQGYQYLRAIEQVVLQEIDIRQAIVATGGSVVYSDVSMKRLRQAGSVVFLDTDLALLQHRVNAAPPRGIANDSRQSYAGIFAERTPLYQQYAQVTLATNQSSPDQIAAAILKQLGFQLGTL